MVYGVDDVVGIGVGGFFGGLVQYEFCVENYVGLMYVVDDFIFFG